MDSCLTFYLCPICFEAAEERRQCHGRPMVCYDGSCQPKEARKPLQDSDGDLRSQAPRWFLQTIASKRTGRRPAGPEGANQRRVAA